MMNFADTEVIENPIDAQPYYEVYSAPFEPGTVCLGGNDADGVIENYWLLIGPDEWCDFAPKTTEFTPKTTEFTLKTIECTPKTMDFRKPSDPRSTVVTSRFFDGSSDFVNCDQPIGSYETVTIDTWIKWHSVTGNHPILNEDNWSAGDLHYQIYNSEFAIY